MCEEGRDHEICNHDEGNQHPKYQEDLTGNFPERYKDSDESLKKIKTLDNGYLWEIWQ